MEVYVDDMIVKNRKKKNHIQDLEEASMVL